MCCCSLIQREEENWRNYEEKSVDEEVGHRKRGECSFNSGKKKEVDSQEHIELVDNIIWKMTKMKMTMRNCSLKVQGRLQKSIRCLWRLGYVYCFAILHLYPLPLLFKPCEFHDLFIDIFSQFLCGSEACSWLICTLYVLLYSSVLFVAQLTSKLSLFVANVFDIVVCL